ncbi:MAG: cold shock domain-containing protein, partial [Alphaproteobacteria bacterium]|nr:cold shock domain-containing protein [Alphaproteobacteria bacterium]
ITPETGDKDAFVHISSLERAGLSTLSEGQKIEFEMVADNRGRMAADNLRLID